MKKYKRFTERLPNGVCRVKCNEHCENFKDSQERMCDAYQECDIAAVGYLAELEDKIENGTLIDINDTWYEKEEINGKTRYKICIHYLTEMVVDFAKTEEEAEAKLKEKQNER